MQNHEKWDQLRQNPDLYYRIYHDKEHIERLKNSVKRYDQDHDTRQKYLQEIRSLVKNLSYNDSREQEVQTDKAIWNEAAAYQYFDERASRASSDHMPKHVFNYDSDDSEERRIQQKLEQEKYNRGIDLKEENTDIEVHKKNAELVFDPTLKPEVSDPALQADISNRSFVLDGNQTPMTSTMQHNTLDLRK